MNPRPENSSSRWPKNGEHFNESLWTKVQQQIADNTNNRTSGRRSKHPSLLVGKIETQDGQLLTPTHTVKRGVRYRYDADFRAASSGKPKTKAKTNRQSAQPIIRIPAAAIERLVTDRLLDDHLELQLSRRGLLQIIRGQTEPIAIDEGGGAEPRRAEPGSANPEDDCICIQTENCLEPSGNGLRLVINDANGPTPSMQLAALLGEAFTLREALLSGPCDSIEGMSKAFQMGNGAITSRIRLTFLSPPLIERILKGDMPNTLSPTRLIDSSRDLPTKWAEQDRFIEALVR